MELNNNNPQPTTQNPQTLPSATDAVVYFSKVGLRTLKARFLYAFKTDYRVKTYTYGCLVVLAIIICVGTPKLIDSLFSKDFSFSLTIGTGAAEKTPEKPKKATEKAKKKAVSDNENPTLASQGIEVIMPKNDNTYASKVTPSVQKAFIEKYSVLAVKEMDTYGIPASVIMAQAVLESNFGTSELFQKNNASFGIKCFSKSCKPGHCTPIEVIHNGDSHKDFYRSYPSVWASFRDHSQFLVNHSYKKLLKSENTYKQWAIGLEQLGYATDSQYAEKLISIIEKYELNRLDNL
jgi:flagellum-specific peptidoglycan hydrolase FlgJ